MSSANLDLGRSIYADWERGDWSSADWADPEIEYRYVGGPDPSSGTGLAGMWKATRAWPHAWDGWHHDATEHRELDDDRVLVSAQGFGRGKTSGLELGALSTPMANGFEIRDGKVTQLISYWDRDLAFADLGLSPEGDPPA